MKLQAKKVRIVKSNGDVIVPCKRIIQSVGSGEVFKKRKGHNRYKYGKMLDDMSRSGGYKRSYNSVALLG